MYGPLQNLIFVTEEEARSYFIPPNSKVLLMSKDKPEFYIKSTDSLGQYTFDIYTFQKKQQPQVVTQADFDAFKQDILTLLTTSAHTPTTTTTQPQQQEVTNNESAQQ